MVKARKLGGTRVAADCHGGPWDASRVIERLPKKLNIQRPNRAKQRHGWGQHEFLDLIPYGGSMWTTVFASWRF